MLLALTGSMGSGKTTVVNIIRSYRPNLQVVKIAQPLYDIQDYVYSRIKRPLTEAKDRRLLQYLGTEWGREIDSNLWINLWKEEVERIQATDPYTLIIADDLRFDNEAQVIKEMGGVLVKVDASTRARADRINLINTSHKSENGVDFKYIDFLIENSGSMEDLEDCVSTLLNNSAISL